MTIIVQLFTKRINVNIDDGGIVIEMNIPYFFYYPRPAAHFSFVAEKELEQRKFLLSEFDILPLTCYPVRFSVQLYVTI